MKAQSNDPRWGEYKTARAYYASDEWLDIVRASLDSHRICLASARRVNNADAIQFYSHQIKACEQQLGIDTSTPAMNTAQQSLFDSLIKT